MDESALLSALARLDIRWSSLESWLWICTSVVVVGLLFEVVVFFWERHDELADFRRGTIHPPESPSRSRFILGLVGTALVTLGVLGELLVGFMAAKVETDMRDDTSHLVALVSERAKQAEQNAQEARERADALELQIKARHVTVEQRNAMLAILKRNPPGNVSVTYLLPAEGDAQQYACEIASVFHDAGWRVPDFPWISNSTTPIRGFSVEFKKDSPQLPVVKAALSVLDKRIVTSTPISEPDAALSLDILVYVGGK